MANAPAVPLPAATLVLLRDASGGPEVLLLRRNRTTRFAPGAYVFPGGRVDAADGDQAMSRLWDGLDAESARLRLGLPPDAQPPALAYYGAAVRETFEETGVLAHARVETGVLAQARAFGSGRHLGSGRPLCATEHGAPAAAVATARTSLLEGAASFATTLERLGARLSGVALEYFAHWVTPADSPRRYDTRFFAAQAPDGAQVVPDEREIAAGVWLSPRDALARSREGRLPLMRPTVRTLEEIQPFPTTAALLAFCRGRSVPRIQPESARGVAGPRRTAGAGS